MPAQTPFKGAPFAVGATPVTIQAEDYDLGGQGVAYNDATVWMWDALAGHAQEGL